MREKLHDLGAVWGFSTVALATSVITYAQGVLNLLAVGISIAFTVWRWRRVAHKTTAGAKRVASVRQGELWDGE